MLAVRLWGTFLILVGGLLIVFNKRYARWGLQLMSWPLSAEFIARFFTMVLAVVLILAGLSGFGVGPGARSPH